jgi:hypothetical protein
MGLRTLRVSVACIGLGLALVAQASDDCQVVVCRPPDAGAQASGPAIDVAIVYAEAGHRDSSYIVAQAAGMSATEAREIAYWTQYPDMTWKYNAVQGVFLNWDFGYRVQTWLHSLRGGEALPVQESLAGLIKRVERPWARGLLIHALGDSYAHTFPDGDLETYKLYRWPIGHALSCDAPDVIARHKDKYLKYLDALYDGLKSRSRTPRQCLVDRLKDFVRCPDWSETTDEEMAIGRFIALQHLEPEHLPKEMDMTLGRWTVHQWIQLVRDGCQSEAGKELCQH